MQNAHWTSWPKGLPHDVTVPATTLYDNLAISEQRFPAKPAIVFFETEISYARLKREVDCMAGYLTDRGVKPGDRVLLMGQNCPQFVIGYYAIVRAGGVVVPVNVMNTAREVRQVAADSGARVAMVSCELLERIDPVTFDQVIEFSYPDYLEVATTWPVPDWVRQQHPPHAHERVTSWRRALEAGLPPGDRLPESRSICALPYTSGTTGRPKGCMHSHRTLVAAVWSAALWRQLSAESVFLGIAPMFHMLGMQNGMNLPILLGATVVITPRWDRVVAAKAIQAYKVTAWSAPTSALVDFFDNPAVDSFDLSSLSLVTGGGGPVPQAVAHQLQQRFGITVNEGYGMTETAAFVFCNPLHRPKAQCLGIPTFGVEARIIDPASGQPAAAGEVGEIVICGPQVTEGYWNNTQATLEAFVELDGRRFLRTGDLGRVANDGYFYMVDRLKRMINVSGFKVWPAEVENHMYGHPAILEACVIGTPDARQGESVKAFVILRPEMRGTVTEADIVAWSRETMAAYKCPRQVVFVDSLPRATTGKILWRELR